MDKTIIHNQTCRDHPDQALHTDMEKLNLFCRKCRAQHSSIKRLYTQKAEVETEVAHHV